MTQSFIPDQATLLAKSGRTRAVGCRECTYWFLGCLHGREKWHDQAVTPNKRYFANGLGEPAMRCDAFEWDHDEERRGRCVVESEATS